MRTYREPELEALRAAQIVAALRSRTPGYLAAWRSAPGNLGEGLVEAWARYLEGLIARLSQAPAKNRLAFLDLAGIDQIAATEARAPVVFHLGEGVAAQTLQMGNKLAASAPPVALSDDSATSGGQIVFETEQTTGLMASKLVEVVSLWPGRDEYVDHSAPAVAVARFKLFDRELLTPAPHHLYLAHPVLLALAGAVEIDVSLDLAQGCSEKLSVDWEYWDGDVWRPFAGPGHESCPPDPAAARAVDGTEGFVASGTAVLTSACAEAAKKKINDHESYWLRARLDESLPTDPGRLLPEISAVRLTAVHRRERRVSIAGFDHEYEAPSDHYPSALAVKVNNLSGGEADGTVLTLRSDDGATIGFAVYTSGPVVFPLATSVPTEPSDLELQLELLGNTLIKRIRYEPPSTTLGRLKVTVTVEIDALIPDKAFADADKVDLSKPFYPLGQSPRPGSTFYLAAPEALSKPGARLTVHLERAANPQEEMVVDQTGTSATAGNGISHTISWEYYDGRRWRSLASYIETTPLAVGDGKPGDLTGDGTVELLVPRDAAPVEVNGEENLWLRVRLLEGAFAVRQVVTWIDGDSNTNTFAYLMPRPPTLKLLQLSYVWEQGPEPAEKVLTFNDFRYVDRTDAARWPEAPFRPFDQISDLTPALYLGFDQPFPLDRLSLYLDLEEELGADRPGLLWERRDRGRWTTLAVEDESRDLRQPGMLSFLGAGDEETEPYPRFGNDLFWLRARRAADGPPPEVVVRAIHVNAVWAVQQETLGDESIGTTRGLAWESFNLRQHPVLGCEHIEVCELTGKRAAVEWRRLALDILGGDSLAASNGGEKGRQALRQLEERLGAEGRELDIEEGELRLRRNPAKEVSEVWVRWRPARALIECGPKQRCYTIDRVAGRVTFGDGVHGLVPPPGSRVLARRYRTGGGRAGNVDAGAIKQLLTGLAGVEKVFNPVPAEGGADTETMSAVSRRGPRTLNHRGRGLTTDDLETMALEASPAVAVARALPTTDASGRRRVPGWVTLVIIPASQAPNPFPSPGLRERVRRYLAARCEAGVVAGNRFVVTGPEYFAVDVEAILLVRDPGSVSVVAEAAREVVARFLHPLYGADGEGWRPGRPVYLSDVAAVLERVDGVDSVDRLSLLSGGVPRGETVEVPPHGTVAAGFLRFTAEVDSGTERRG